jgi:MFS family permease
MNPTTLRAAAPNASLQRAHLAVMICFVINGAFLANWIVRIPDIKAQLHLTDGQLGSALLCVPAGAFVGQVLTGWLLPTWGSRRILTLMALAMCVVFPLLGVAPSLPALMLTLVLFGLGLGGMDVAMNAQAASVEDAYGRPLMSGFHGMWSVAGLVAASAGGLLVGRGTPVGLHFLGVAAVGLLALAVAYPGWPSSASPPPALRRRSPYRPARCCRWACSPSACCCVKARSATGARSICASAWAAHQPWLRRGMSSLPS